MMPASSQRGTSVRQSHAVWWPRTMTEQFVALFHQCRLYDDILDMNAHHNHIDAV